jgi:hypothetical protein
VPGGYISRTCCKAIYNRSCIRMRAGDPLPLSTMSSSNIAHPRSQPSHWTSHTCILVSFSLLPFPVWAPHATPPHSHGIDVGSSLAVGHQKSKSTEPSPLCSISFLCCSFFLKFPNSYCRSSRSGHYSFLYYVVSFQSTEQ